MLKYNNVIKFLANQIDVEPTKPCLNVFLHNKILVNK